MHENQGTSAFVPPEDPFRERLGRLGEKLPTTHGTIDPRVFWQVARRLSVTRTIYWSLRSRGRFLVARRSKIVKDKTARIEFGPRGYLLLGFHHHGPNRSLINLGKNARMVVKGTVQAWRGSQLLVFKGGLLELGDGCIFNEESKVMCLKHVSIGNGSGLSWGASVLDSDLHPIAVNGVWLEPHSPVRIGDHSMIGAGATILKGVTIGNGCIVGAGSVVTKDVPDRCLVAGNPAKVVYTDVDWK
ncbi:MAG TPA: acyltransferase [Acidimicrobiales bacterium]|nr:acyltransferase [Acidimicrobiales bacterium]